MYIFPKYTNKSQAENIIFLVDSTQKTDGANLSKAQQNYVRETLKDENFLMLNEYGKSTLFCKYEDLKLDANKEKLRLLAHKSFESTKSTCKSLVIRSASTDALEIFIEAFALSSYEFTKYFTKPKKQKLAACSVRR
jgi:hypothetical protein